MVTQTGIIIDGYARWEIARSQGRKTILCLVYDLTEEEALRWLIQSHRPSKGLNGFSRSLLALDLEPQLQDAARANQRIGGQTKGSSSLTEAQKVDVRAEIAAIANVSTGNISKVKQVLKSAAPAIQDAVRVDEISIHRAEQWSNKSHEEQLKELEDYRSRKGTKLVSRRCIQKHVARMVPSQLIPPTLGDLLKPFMPECPTGFESILVAEIDVPGRVAYFTKDAMGTLTAKEDPVNGT